MIVGILADTHDRLDKIKKAADFFNHQKCEVVLHAGDFVAPFAVKALHQINAKIISVFGNNDGEKDGITKSMRPTDEVHAPPHLFTLDNKQFLLMHDPAHLNEFKESGNFDYIIYGHLHQKEYKPGKPALINPGECCGWVEGTSSVALLDTSSGKVTFQEL